MATIKEEKSLIDQFKEDNKSFEEQFDPKKIWVVPSKDNIETIKEVKSHNTQSILHLVEKMIEDIEERRIPPRGKLENNIDFVEKMTIYNFALSDILAPLVEFRDFLISEIKK